ncbi:MAG: serine protease [Armatimonadetes bacterium]|nr:serine protease [Armatimonadota bacterium]
MAQGAKGEFFMKRVFATVFILTNVLVSVFAQTAAEVYQQTHRAVVTLLIQDKEGETVGSGTGFFISPNGDAVTAYHVIAGAEKVVAKFADGSTADVIGMIDGNQTADVALIRIKTKGNPFLRLKGSVPDIGSDTYVIGSPKGLEFSISQGIVNQVRTEDGLQVIQFSAPVSAGNSGSPLLDKYGEALGVVSYQLTDGQNLNFAVPSSYITQLDSKHAVCALPQDNSSFVKTADSAEFNTWKNSEFAHTGLQFLSPVPIPVSDSTIQADLATVVTKFRAGGTHQGDYQIAATYFQFKKGECPSALALAEEIESQRKKSAIKLDDGTKAEPKILPFEVSGFQEAKVVIASYLEKDEAMVECSVVLKQKDQMWIVTLSYPASDESGPANLETFLESIKMG